MDFKDLENKDIPEEFLEEYQNIKDQEEQFVMRLTVFQGSCQHEWEKVMVYDENYSSMVGQRTFGEDVLSGWCCKKCKLFKPRPDRLPFRICHKCGGKMKFDHSEYCGQDRIFIHKCEECGHEYDTT